MIRPPIIHLAGNAVPCCGGWFLMDCNGIYKCPCGKHQEARAKRIIEAMELLPDPREGKDQASNA